MPIDEKEYKRLKAEVTTYRAARERAAGQLDAAMQRLQEEFECDTIEQAEKLLKKLDKEAAAAEVAYENAFKEFKNEWDGRLTED